MYIKRLVNETWCRLRGTAFLPPVLLFVLLNLWNYHDLVFPNTSSKYFMDERMLLLLPIGIGVISVVSCLPYLMQDGCEILYLQRNDLTQQLLRNDIYYGTLLTIEYVLVYYKNVGEGWIPYFRYLLLSLAVSQICVLILYTIKHVNMALVLLTGIYLLFYLLHESGRKFLDLFTWNYEDETYLIQILALLLITLFGSCGRRKMINGYDSY